MGRKLHIGGELRAPGWEVFNAIPADYVDHLGDAMDLSRFPSETFSEIYASHIAEHFDFTGQLQSALAEWHRVLEPGGLLSISVPDLDTIARLFLDKARFSADERFFLMMMMFGAHIDAYDYHVVGLNEEFLVGFLRDAGFATFERVRGFGIFEDISTQAFGGELISVNLKAWKARRP
jgi:predicted SAM-dependent methyltransferase